MMAEVLPIVLFGEAPMQARAGRNRSDPCLPIALMAPHPTMPLPI